MVKKFGKVFGTFDGLKPNLFINDTDLIKSVFVKDFDHFINRRVPRIIPIKLNKYLNWFYIYFENILLEISAARRKSDSFHSLFTGKPKMERRSFSYSSQFRSW